MSKRRTIQVKGSGEPVPGLRDPLAGYGEDTWIIRWVPLPIPMAVAPDGMLVVTSPPTTAKDGREGFAKFRTKAEAQAAIDADPAYRDGECVPVTLAEFEAGRKRRQTAVAAPQSPATEPGTPSERPT